MSNNFKYEVAFSFLNGDEHLALAINDLIQDRYPTFIYSLHQVELAGRDGQEMFDEIFGHQSRLVVIIYRKGWGESDWTRMEETSIKNRAYNTGYDFTLWIMLADSTPPQYVPKTRLWYDIERWGNSGAASIIESKINELGGFTREESASDKIQRLNRELEFEKYRKSYLRSKEGVKDITIELDELYNYLDKLSKSINEQKSEIYVNIERKGLGIRLECNSLILNVSLVDCYANTLEHSSLIVEYEKGWQYGREKGNRELVEEFHFDIDRALKKIWKNSNDQE